MVRLQILGRTGYGHEATGQQKSVVLQEGGCAVLMRGEMGHHRLVAAYIVASGLARGVRSEEAGQHRSVASEGKSSGCVE